VRLWLFELREGFILRKGGSNQASRAEIKGLDPAFLKNLETIIVSAHSRGLKLYLTFLSGGEMTDDEANPRANFYRNLLNNRNGELDAYHDLVLKPVLRLFNRHSETIFGVDLINEIEGPIQNFYWLTGWFGAREWIATEVNFIKRISPSLKITVTAGYSFPAEEITLGLFSGLGLDFYDLHIYSDSGMYDGVTALCERSAADGVPVILGEFGQKTEIDDDALQAKATYNFLKIARENCFAGALAWRYDKAEKWWRYIRPDGSPRPAVEVMKMFSK
jgi:hypothetical protein